MSDISHKSERLAVAVYMLTGFFNESEPLKWKLREAVSTLASLGSTFKNGFTIEREELSARTSRLVLEIRQLLSIAKQAGLISPANHELVDAEFDKYLSMAGRPPRLKEALETGIVERSLPKPPTVSKQLPQSGQIVKDIPGNSTNDRQRIILGLLRQKNEIMIKDVAPLIPGVSEKTIQRELLAMVKAGTLRKVGEKRWSRYTLA